MAIESRRVFFPGHNGVELGGILDVPHERSRHGAVVLAHCFTCSKDLKANVRIARGLAAHGWTTLRFDFAGIGNSQGSFAESNFRTNCDDLLGACNFLNREGFAPRLLFGHSFGGATSIAVANRIQTLAGIVTLASPSDTAHLADLLEKMDPKIASEGLGQVTIGGRSFPISQQMTDDFRSYDLTQDLARLAKPLLILHSPSDQTVGYHHAIRIYSMVQQANQQSQQRPEVSLMTLPQSDHLLVNNPKDIKFVIDLVHVWLTRIVDL